MRKVLKRRANLLYRLRKKGVRCNTKERTIFFPYATEPEGVRQISRLREEYGFVVQFEI
jgi:cytosine/adenosine deaminase-related metal-dependent hydrolase